MAGTHSTTGSTAERPRTALVLGAGGTIGIAHHAGVLKALADAGIDPASADLVVGTSAGAVVGSILRAGHDLEEIWDLAQRDANKFIDGEPFFRRDVVFSKGWRTPVGLARRAVGSGYVLGRSVLRWPPVLPPVPMQRFYRAGFASVTEQRAEFAAWAGEDWPDAALRLCTLDIVTGRRVVIGAPERTRPALPDAMRAASAVPMLYPPVRLGRRVLVDGGVTSSTHMDVALDAGAELIIVAAPMAYDPTDPPPPVLRVARELFHRALNREIRAAERQGARVLVVRPDGEAARWHGVNFMRAENNAHTAELARRTTDDLLRSHGGRSFGRAWAAAGSAPRVRPRAGYSPEAR